MSATHLLLRERHPLCLEHHNVSDLPRRDESSRLTTVVAPLSPPRRGSSLAFSQRPATMIRSPLGQRNFNGQTQVVEHPECSQPNIGKKRTPVPSCVHDGPSPGHVAQMQRVFQVAKATLHRDMFAASSPASSIESRMNLDRSNSLQIDGSDRQRAGEEQSEPDSKTWRYSTAPHDLAAPSLDVREPLPSPILPELPLQIVVPGSEAVEPISSGFPSPNMHEQPSMTNTVLVAGLSSDKAYDLARDASLSPLEEPIIDAVFHTELDQPLTELKVSSDSGTDTAEESPIVSHLKRRSYGSSMDVGLPESPNCDVYLSKTAEAAAESAKAKRRLLRGTFASTRDEDSQSSHETDLDIPRLVEPDLVCPDPALYHMSSMTPCPDPFVHQSPFSPSMLRRPASGYGVNTARGEERPPMYHGTIPFGAPRATATGSPMPFSRTRMRPATSHGEKYVRPVLPSQYAPPISHQQYHQQVSVNEHFQPGWYFAKQPRQALTQPTYSFSTAASKVIGSDQAPDSRIRDSYKTDTLTALARPQNRYRKNGIGAVMVPRGVNRYYQRPPSMMRPNSRIQTCSRQTYAGVDEVRFRSSPPRGLGLEHFPANRRKRAADDTFIVAEHLNHGNHRLNPAMAFKDSIETVELDEPTKTAVRLSIFGTNTPEALHNARQGIRELSPNVQVFRKGTPKYVDACKQRRPSYWDGDLKAVKESPAGRGGVNSPVSAQASMRAQFESASLARSEMTLDEDDLSGEVARAGRQLEHRLSALKNAPVEDQEHMDVDLA